MVLSAYYSDETIIHSLRSFFSVEEQYKIDFRAALSMVVDYDIDYYSLIVKDKRCLIHKVTGDVQEVNDR